MYQNRASKTNIPAAVSVIMAVYNGERYLEEAIQSVLNQSYRSFEIILVDDGSEDGSARIARRYSPPLIYSFQKHFGLSTARNRGAALAQGQFLSWLDADDIWEKDKLAKQMAAFKNQPDLKMVFGHVVQFFSPDLPLEERRKIHLDEKSMPGYSIGALLIKKQAFDEVGHFESKWELGPDMQWLLRAKEQGLKDLMLPDIVFRRRIHANNMGRIRKQFQHHYLQIIKETLDRRKATGSASGPFQSNKK